MQYYGVILSKEEGGVLMTNINKLWISGLETKSMRGRVILLKKERKDWVKYTKRCYDYIVNYIL